MPQRETLVHINVITDDDTGMYEIGEIDGIFQESQLEYWLNLYGADKILNHLCSLIHQVKEVDRNRRPIETCYNAENVGEKSG